MSEIQSEIQAKARSIKWKGKRNYLLAYTLHSTAALASGVATIWTAALVSRKTPPSLWVAIVTAIPAVAVILNETLKPELKARWCYEKRVALDALVRRSKYSGTPDNEIVQKWNELDTKMEREWPRFGKSSPYKRRT